MAISIFKDVKIGDQFLDKQRNHIITITEITDNGAKYSCPPYHVFPARYGHTHDTCNYSIGKCKVLCNPKGYGTGRIQENKEFDTNASFEV